MMDKRELLRLQKKLEADKLKRVQLKERAKVLRESLEKDYNVDTLEKAKKLLSKYTLQLAELSDTLTKLGDEIQEKWSD